MTRRKTEAPAIKPGANRFAKRNVHADIRDGEIDQGGADEVAATEAARRSRCRICVALALRSSHTERQ